MHRYIFGYDADHPVWSAHVFGEKQIDTVIAGEYTPAALAAFENAGIRTLLCFGALTHAQGVRPAQDVWGRESIWFSSGCPNDRENFRRRVERAIKAAQGTYGVWVDGARFASFASAEGEEAFYTCFCPACMADMRRRGLDAEGIRDAVRCLAENIPALGTHTLHCLRDWLAYRRAVTAELLGKFIQQVKEKQLETGAFVFAPTLWRYVGQDACCDLPLDVVAPMLYRAYPHETGTACLNHEYAAMLTLAQRAGLALPQARQMAEQLTGCTLPCGDAENILRGGFAPQQIAVETKLARGALPQNVRLAPILQIEDTLLSECERQALQAGADAVGWFAFGQGVWPKRG